MRGLDAVSCKVPFPAGLSELRDGRFEAGCARSAGLPLAGWLTGLASELRRFTLARLAVNKEREQGPGQAEQSRAKPKGSHREPRPGGGNKDGFGRAGCEAVEE